jgi:hypothetical protein
MKKMSNKGDVLRKEERERERERGKSMSWNLVENIKFFEIVFQYFAFFAFGLVKNSL